MAEAAAGPAEFQLTEAEPGAAARSRLYARFAHAFEYPRGELLRNLHSGEVFHQLAADTADLPYNLPWPNATDTAEQLDNEVDTDELQIRHTSLFDVVASGSPMVSLLERRYSDEKTEKPLWENLFRFYEHFGLDFSEGGIGSTPDHLSVELEFMHYLGFLEAGTPGEVADLRRGQRDFLSRHLNTWTDPFTDSLRAAPDSAPYAEIAAWLAEFTKADEAYLSDQVEEDNT